MEYVHFNLIDPEQHNTANGLRRLAAKASQSDQSLVQSLEAMGLHPQPEQGCFAATAHATQAGGWMLDWASAWPTANHSPAAPAGPAASPQVSAAAKAALEAFERCLQELPYSPATRKNYLKAFANFVQGIAPRAPHAMTSLEVEQWLIARQSHSGVASAHNTLINAIQLYFRHVLNRPWNQTFLQRPKRTPKEPETLSKAELRALLDHVENTKHRILMLMAYSAGLRLQELLNLRRDDIDLQRQTIRVQGNGSRHRRRADRFLPLSPKLIQPLRSYLEAYNPKVWLFEGQRQGRRYSERSAQVAMQQSASRAGITRQVSLKTLRGSYAAHQLEAGVGIHALQDLLGHDSIRSTARFAGVARRKVPASPADSL